MYWEMGTSSFEGQTEDKVVKSITHGDDKQQQLRRDADVTSLWERYSSCVRGPVHTLRLNLCPGVPVVLSHMPVHTHP